MGEHRAPRLPVRGRELRSAYTRLLGAYGKLLRDHRQLEAEYRDLISRTSVRAPSVEVELWQPVRQTTWGATREAMAVDQASELVRDIGLLTSAGG